jgi:hypothetical protein
MILNHPFHVEDWDGEVETLVADLSQLPAIDPSRLFPTDDKTRFGDWVKAGALKLGDKVSTLSSVPDFVPDDNAFGPRVAANDNGSDNAAGNQPLTVTEILRDNTPTRVYNFEVESLSGEITHNYFVGEDQAWVHNAGIGRNDLRRTFLYKLYDQAGNFLKWGITINPKTRYPKCKKYKLVPQACGCRSDMLDLERPMVENDPGPMNFEPWAGSGR